MPATGLRVGFKTVSARRKVVCEGCERPTDVVLGVSILAEGRCPRCGGKGAALVVQEPAARVGK
jgi:hypothetical protein